MKKQQQQKNDFEIAQKLSYKVQRLLKNKNQFQQFILILKQKKSKKKIIKDLQTIICFKPLYKEIVDFVTQNGNNENFGYQDESGSDLGSYVSTEDHDGDSI